QATNMNIFRATILMYCLLYISGSTARAGAPPPAPMDAIFDVRRFGAVGDLKTLDTKAINAAIEACSSAGGGQVRLSPGRYLSGTVKLRSHVTIYLDAGDRLVGTPDLTQYEQPKVPAVMPEARFGGGKWN